VSVVADRTKLKLYAAAGARCSFSGCGVPLYQQGSVVGEIAHIRARSPGGPRYVPGLTDDQLNGLANLLLLCQMHHKIVDDHPDEYPIDALQSVKAQHESGIQAMPVPLPQDLIDALVLPVSDEWWRRPAAPVFRLSLASTRPVQGPWLFEVQLGQTDGETVGDLRVRFRGIGVTQVLAAPRLIRAREWRVPNFTPPLGGAQDPELGPKEFALELAFWWSGAERHLLHVWPSVGDFQKLEPDMRLW